jgi:hypothetical protein
MDPSWPLFFLVGKRPALIKVDVTGSGSAPDVRVEGWLGNVSLGVNCLKGPAELPAVVSAAEHHSQTVHRIGEVHYRDGVSS